MKRKPVSFANTPVICTPRCYPAHRLARLQVSKPRFKLQGLDGRVGGLIRNLYVDHIEDSYDMALVLSKALAVLRLWDGLQGFGHSGVVEEKTCVSVCTYIYTHTCIGMCVYVDVCMCMYIYIYRYIYRYTCMHS